VNLWHKVMAHIFKDRIRQRRFERTGYIEVPALNEEDLRQLLDLFGRHLDQYAQPFHTTHFSGSLSYKQEINDAIIRIVFPRLAPYLINCKPIFGNLMVKHGMNGYFMPLHADWTYVDEDQCRSIAAWIPLVDSDENNGCLGIIEGSHRVSEKIRGPRIQQTSYKYDKEWVWKYGKLLPTRAGHAVLFDHALMHFSPPNNTAQSRPALNLSIVPCEADIIHYCIPEGTDLIEKYKVEDGDFYLKYDNFQRPQTNTLISTLPADSVKWVDEKMQHYTLPSKSMFENLSEVYSRLIH
jgi:Phytanoyl-CoA dioxygenase (PhyH)